MQRSRMLTALADKKVDVPMRTFSFYKKFHPCFEWNPYLLVTLSRHENHYSAGSGKQSYSLISKTLSSADLEMTWTTPVNKK